MGERVVGNIFIRDTVLEAGGICGDHAHNFDHATLFLAGKWHLRKKHLNGEVQELVVTAPAYLKIDAGIRHEITCIEDGFFWCVYSHRMPDGSVVEQFTGWEKAYV